MKQITHTSLQSSYDCLYAVIRDVLSCFYLHPILCGLISLNTLYKNSCTFLLLLVVFLILHGNTSHLWCCQLFCSFTLPLLTTSLFLCTSLNFLCFLFGNNHFCLERPFLILAGIPVKYHQSHQLKCCHHACCKAAVVSSFMSTYFFYCLCFASSVAFRLQSFSSFFIECFAVLINIWFGDESVILDHIVGPHSFPYFGADQLLCTGTPMNHFVICWSLFLHQTLTLYASSIQQEICGYTARSCGAFSTSLFNTSCTSCKNLWVNFSGVFSPSLISCSEMNSKLQQAQNNSAGASEWRVCVRSEEEKKRILESCHEGAAGGHFGRDKILEKICSRFHWRNMVEEIQEYMKMCPQCRAGWMPISSSQTRSLIPSLFSRKFGARWAGFLNLFSNKCVRIVCIGVLLTMVFLNAGWYRLDWASADYI